MNIKTIKAVLAFAATSIMLLSCEQQNIVTPVNFSVRLDTANVYHAGIPLHFSIKGDADYIVFYSGEKGHEYRYRDRTNIPLDSIQSINLDVEYMWRYGKFPALDLYLTDGFEGLLDYPGMEDPSNGLANRETINRIYSSETSMEGWDKSTLWNNFPGEWRTESYDISKYSSNFCMAFHWHPNNNNHLDAQTSYWVNGAIKMKYRFNNQLDSVITDLKEVSFNTVVMNEQDSPYLLGEKYRNRGDTTNIGTIHLAEKMYAIFFEGCHQTFLEYNIDQWCISKPKPLNAIRSDQGRQIKSVMNPIFDFEYTFSEPGTYKVTFVGINDNYQGSSTKIQELTVIITDTPVYDD